MEAIKSTPMNIVNFLSVQTYFMQATAMYPVNYRKYLPRCLSFLSKVLNSVYYLIVLFISFHIAVFHAKTSFDTLGKSLDDLSDFLTLTIIYSFTFFTEVYFLFRQRKCVELFKYLNKSFRMRSSKGLTYITAEPSFKTTSSYAIWWIVLCIGGVMSWAAYPFLVGKRILPLRCWYPFDELAPVTYEVVYFLQFLGQIEVGLAFGMGSCLFMSLVMLICGQFDILFCSLKNVYYTAKLMENKNIEELKNLQKTLNFENEELNQYYFNISEIIEEIEMDSSSFPKSTTNNLPHENDLKRELQLSLKDCIKHHEDIVKVCKMFEDFYNPFCLVKSMQVTFQLCFLAFVFVNTPLSGMRTINLAEYLFLTVSEWLMYTYYGEVLQQQSVRVGEALLRAPWEIFGTQLKKEILILLPSTIKPMRITGGKFFNIDVERFRLLVGTSFSYFTLLQNLGGEN